MGKGTQEYLHYEKSNGDYIRIPVVTDDQGEEWYPVSYINQKVMDRQKLTSTGLNKKYSQWLSKKKLMYFGSASYIEANALNFEGLTKWIEGMNIGSMSLDQKKNLNLFCKLTGVDYRAEVVELYCKELPKEYDEKYSDYETDCITGVKGGYDKFKLCTSCQTYYPMHENFFSKNKTTSDEFQTRCRKCANGNFAHCNDMNTYVYSKLGLNAYRDYINLDLLDFSVKWKYLSKLNSKEYQEQYILRLSNLGLVTDFTLTGLADILKSNSIPSKFNFRLFSVRDICASISNQEIRKSPWKYKGLNRVILKMSNEEVKTAFWEYVEQTIGDEYDIFTIDYFELMKLSKLSTERDRNNILEFAMRMTNYKHPSYKFNIAGVNYWKNKDNRNKALKHLIENHLNYSSFDRLPLYLTNHNLKLANTTMRGVLKKYYNDNLFNWVDECYPGVFDPRDFNMHWSRDEFDSAEEMNIHEILKDKFGRNLFYNTGVTATRVTLLGCQPDWFVFTEDKVLLIEYFGLYNKNNTSSKRVRDYINRTDKKIEKYKSLSHYTSIYIFPEDLKNNYEQLHSKLDRYQNPV